MRQMVQNGAKIVVFQREPARPPGRHPSPPGAPRLARYYLELRCSLAGRPVGGRRQVWIPRGGASPPVL